MIVANCFDKIYIHRGYVDMRKSINGLSMIVAEEMELDLFASYLFVFCNRRRNKLKMLYWDQTGFALWYKRLEKDKFIWPKKMVEDVIEVEHHQLALLLGGYDLWQQKPHETLHYTSVNWRQNKNALL